MFAVDEASFPHMPEKTPFTEVEMAQYRIALAFAARLCDVPRALIPPEVINRQVHQLLAVNAELQFRILEELKLLREDRQVAAAPEWRPTPSGSPF